MTDIITSPSNPVIGRVRGLLARRDRRTEERAFVVEGVRAVNDALAAGIQPHLFLLREDITPPANLPPTVAPRWVAHRLFDGLSETANPQGILAIVPMPDLDIPSQATPLLLVIDRLRDPGNLGALLRTAAAAGVTAVYLTPESVDPFNSKVVRAGMGAHWRVPLRTLASDDPAALAALAPVIAVTVADAPLSYDALDWTGPTAVVIGSEADGVSPTLEKAATHLVSIPMAGGVESLNAAAAGAVVLFEAARQRRNSR